ncbi:hypothetical protein BKA69DRAFT_1098463 [Paraphysoderma sedebokerense]|nr:hypothetical protein BKA69DRAFT_1098463 [Paraphysoderma sedebokerense]
MSSSQRKNNPAANLLPRRRLYNTVLAVSKANASKKTLYKDTGPGPYNFESDPNPFNRKSSFAYSRPESGSLGVPANRNRRPSVLDHASLNFVQPGKGTEGLSSVENIVDYQKEVKMPSVKEKVAFWLDTSRSGRIWEFFDAFLNVLFCSLYLWNTTYVRDVNKNPQALPSVNRYFEVTLSTIILFQWLPRVFFHPAPMSYLLTKFSFLTFLATVPVICAFIISSFEDDYYHSYFSAGMLVYLYPFRWARLHDAISICLVPVKDPILHISMIARKAVNLVIAILFTILTVAAFIHIVVYKHQGDNDTTFLDVFYFTIMSSTSGLSTSGITADNPFTKLLLLYILIAGAFYIPTHLSELLTMIQNRSKFTVPYAHKKSQQHVIVCGNFEITSMLEFLKEFFCSDHGLSTITTRVVILNPNEPNDELSALLQDPAYLSRVQYVKGSATSFSSLRKVSAHTAVACFVLANKFSQDDLHEEDAEGVMRALAIKRFDRTIPLFVETILPENQSHFEYIAEHILCVDELKLGILSQSCRIPGFATLIALLTTSITEESRLELVQAIDRHTPSVSFLKSYLRGVSQEIYCTPLPASFIGLTFLEAAEIVYSNFNSCLIGIGFQPELDIRQRLPPSETLCVVLNPGEYVIKGDELGFLISTEIEIVEQIKGFEFSEEEAIRVDEDSEYLESSPLLGRDGRVRFNDAPNISTEQSTAGIVPFPKLPKSGPTSPPIISPTNARLKKKLKQKRGMALDKDELHETVLDVEGPGLSSDEDLGPNPDLVFFPPTKSSSTSSIPIESNTPQAVVQSPPCSPSVDQSVATDVSDVKSTTLIRTTSTSSFIQPKIKSPLPDSVTSHLLIADCSPTFPRNLDVFIAPLRGEHITNPMPIVILSPAIDEAEQMVADDDGDGEEESEIEKLRRLGDVYFVKGSPLMKKDLLKAKVDKAKRAVVMSNKKYYDSAAKRTADASALLSVLNIEAIASDEIFIVVEFIHRENMKYIGDTDVVKTFADESTQVVLRPSFMAGHVFASSMLDSVITQTYYNPFLLDIIKRLIFSGRKTGYERALEEEEEEWIKSTEAGGEEEVEINDETGRSNSDGRKERRNPKSSHLFQVLAPKLFVGRPYSALFTYLLRSHCSVSIGLYRTISHNGNVLSYTLVNPRPEMIVRRDDKVVVLGTERPVF